MDRHRFMNHGSVPGLFLVCKANGRECGILIDLFSVYPSYTQVQDHRINAKPLTQLIIQLRSVEIIEVFGQCGSYHRRTIIC